jgi:hypothetical protein
MSILTRLNPLHIVRAVDTVPHLQNLGEKLRDDLHRGRSPGAPAARPSALGWATGSPLTFAFDL